MSANDADPQLKYPWQKPLLDAFTEFNPKWLPVKVSAAQRAISARLRDLSSLDLNERIALEDAIRSLRTLFQVSEKREIA
jgi:hypothetical protein